MAMELQKQESYSWRKNMEVVILLQKKTQQQKVCSAK